MTLTDERRNDLNARLRADSIGDPNYVHSAWGTWHTNVPGVVEVMTSDGRRHHVTSESYGHDGRRAAHLLSNMNIVDLPACNHDWHSVRAEPTGALVGQFVQAPGIEYSRSGPLRVEVRRAACAIEGHDGKCEAHWWVWTIWTDAQHDQSRLEHGYDTPGAAMEIATHTAIQYTLVWDRAAFPRGVVREL